MAGGSAFVMFSNHQLESILAQWPIGRLPIRSIQPVAGGLSGAHIWKIDTATVSGLALGSDAVNTAWALKAWPEETSSIRLQEIHDRVGRAAEDCELLSEPKKTVDHRTIVHAHDRLWDCFAWVSGDPLSVDAPDKSLEAAGEAIARVHQAFSINRNRSIDGVPRSIEHRLQRFGELSIALQPILRKSPTLDAISNKLIRQVRGPADECHALAGVLSVALERLRESWLLSSRQIQQQLLAMTEKHQELPIRHVLRDVHRGHVFADRLDGKITGLIDFDAVGLDSPSCDVARFAGSFSNARFDTLQATAAGYRRIQTFTEREYELARILMLANVLGGLANWVVWLIGEKKSFLCPAILIRDRISHLIASNCRI